MTPLDLTSCDLEQVQYSGAIMPYGVLLVLSADLQIVGASANSEATLGIGAGDLITMTPEHIFTPLCCASVKAGLARIEQPTPPQHLGYLECAINRQRFDAVAHRSGAFFILELEPSSEKDSALSGSRLFSEVHESISALKLAETWQEGITVAVHELRRLTGFDTVLAVQILDDGSMHTVAEARNEAFPPFLDKRFPRSDIPEPGRRQMLLMPVHYAPDLEYEPAPIVLMNESIGSGQLDLSRSMLRSVSSMCNQFYLNVGVHARIVLPLLDNQRQWGFFVCWNAVASQLGYAKRLACQSFAEVAGLLLNEKHKTVLQAEKVNISHRLAKLLTDFSSDLRHAQAMEALPQELMSLLKTSGSVLCLGNQFTCVGATPSHAAITTLLAWLSSQEDIFSTDMLPSLLALPEEDQRLATGLLAIRLLDANQYLLGFRREWEHEVTWAGDPRKPVVYDHVSGENRLTARGSFDAWVETVRGRSRPWQHFELDALADLRNFVVIAQARIISDRAKEEEQETQKKITRLKSEFLANMSHEIRTPLNGVLGMAQVGYRESLGRGRLQEIFSRILGSGKILLGVINDILDFSKIEAGKLNIESIPIDPTKIVDEAIEILQERATDKGIQLFVDKATDLPTAIMGDPIRLTQILLNLVSNAVKFTTVGEIRLKAHTESNQLIFSVADTGIGMTEEQLGRLFKPFEQADSSTTREFGGTGLGLSISGHLIDLMQGSIHVTSEIGHGSVFTVKLPLVLSQQLAVDTTSSFIQASMIGRRRLNQIRILVAEDNELNQMVLWDLLGREGAQLKLVNNGQAAVDSIVTGESLFDLVLMDVQMPVMDGLEATQHIRRHAPDLKIIGQTAFALSEERQKCLDAGMNDVITKPIEIDLLVSAILRQLDISQLQPISKTIENYVTDENTTGEIIDWLLLEQRYGSRPDFLDRLLITFVKSNTETPELIRNVVQSNPTELHRIAHSIAGTAGFLLANEVVKQAKATLASINGQDSDLIKHAEALASAITLMLNEIQQRKSF